MVNDTARQRANGQSLADFVYARIRRDLLNGVLKPGERLLETELAEELNVSRTPIREAIHKLISEGIVVIAPSRGVMVLELNKRQVHEIYALREVLEGAAARLAARFASPEEVAVLRNALESSAHFTDPQQYAELNRAFHQTICEAAHNEYLAKALDQLASSLALLPGTTFQVEGRLDGAKKEHAAMLEAIEAGDEDLAESLARDHIRRAQLARVGMMFETSWRDDRRRRG